MKTKLLLSFLLSFYFCLLSSQVPQGFNYQAIARDVSGNPITGQLLPVRITIQSDSLGGTTFWIEEHLSVSTNSFGLFTLILGKGERKTGSTAATFNDIDWSVTPKYIKTEIDYSGWKNMGSSRLWAVPYSMVAGELGGSLDRLKVKGQTTENDSALFEVKNNHGQTVFAVYNEGVRVYVDDGVGKSSTKGGFAIGGFETAKTPGQEFFRVTRDSTRVYVNQAAKSSTKGGFAIGGFDQVKGVLPQRYFYINNDSIRMYIDNSASKSSTKGGFAIGGFDQVKTGNANFFDISTISTGIINPPQNRVVWYPVKNAFLAGRVLIEKPDSVGLNSFAAGYLSKAKGQYSQALGYQAMARGDFSTAIGKNAIANSPNSFSFGDGSKSLKNDSYAFGAGASAKGLGSYALGAAGRDTLGNLTGNMTTASGDYSIAIGQGSRAAGLQSFAFGSNVYATGKSSTAMGSNSLATGTYSIAMGENASASGYNSISFGSWAVSSGTQSVAIGSSNALGPASIALGTGATASGSGSTSIGYYSKASGMVATALGCWTIASGIASTATGWGTFSKGWMSTCMGIGTIARGNTSLVIGAYNDTTLFEEYPGELNNPLCQVFVIGIGTDENTRRNAITVLRSGKTSIGHATPTEMLDVNGNARFRSVGSGTFAYNLNVTSDGTLTTTTSDVSMKKDIVTIGEALKKVLEMNGVYFSWKNDSLKNRRVGFIAQEMEKVIPEVVFTNPVDGLKGINYSEITAVLAQAVKEQQQQIESTKQENQKLRAELDELKSLVNNLIANQTGQGGR